MANSPLSAYASVEKTTLEGRALEAHVLTRAADKLFALRENWDTPERDHMLDEALRHNQKVWSFFQVEVSQPGNPMPDAIKSNILTLSMFIDKRTFEIMAYPEKEKLDILIAINRNLAAGLRGDPEDRDIA